MKTSMNLVNSMANGAIVSLKESPVIAYDAQPNEIVLNCNFVSVEDNRIKDYSAGNISTNESEILIEYLNYTLGNGHIKFYCGEGCQHLLIIKDGDKRIENVRQPQIVMQSSMPYWVKAQCPEAQCTALLLNELIIKSQLRLQNHPINLTRVSKGLDTASSIWLWDSSNI
ncbi:MAG: hypothetical protein ACRDDZ_13165 [Marinifilaceae bacterium]